MRRRQFSILKIFTPLIAGVEQIVAVDVDATVLKRVVTQNIRTRTYMHKLCAVGHVLARSMILRKALGPRVAYPSPFAWSLMFISL